MGKGKIRVRRAKPQDRKLFLKLYKEYLEELKDAHGSPLPSERNLEIIGRIFDSYVSGELDGVVLLVAQDAMVLHGEQGAPLFETNLGRIATGWGAYVREELRGQGVSQAMYKRSKKLLRSMGFDHLVGSAYLGVGGGDAATTKFGFNATAKIVSLDLREEEQ